MNAPDFPLQSPISGGNIVERGWLQRFAELGRILSGQWGRGSISFVGGSGRISVTPYHALVIVTWPSSASISAGDYAISGYSFDFGVIQVKRGALEYTASLFDGKIRLPDIPSGADELVLSAYLSVKNGDI